MLHLALMTLPCIFTNKVSDLVQLISQSTTSVYKLLSTYNIYIATLNFHFVKKNIWCWNQLLHSLCIETTPRKSIGT